MSGRPGPTRVLLVEDNPGDAGLVREALRGAPGAPFELRWVTDLERCHENGWLPQVALLDLSLPGSTGTATVQRFRQLQPSVPVVVLTGLDDDATALEALRVGAQDYLVKDELDPRRLAQTIRYAVERHRMLAELERRTRQLVESEDRLSTVLESLADGVVVVDQDGEVAFSNTAAATLLRRSRDRLHETPFELPLGEEGDPLETRLDRGGAPAVDLEIRWTPIRWDGRPARAVSLRDVTSLLAAQRTLQERQRLEAVSRLAGGMAHGLNNVLQSISTATSLIGAAAGGGEPRELVRLAETIDGQVARGAALTRQLLVFSGQDVGRPTAVDVPSAVHRLRGRLEAVVPSQIRLVITTDGGPAAVEIDPEGFELLLENLVRNAAEAIDGRGVVTVAAATTPDNLVRLEVRDTGRGIGSAEIRRVFEPFYSTKGASGARGLGLSVVHGIAEQAGGTVGVESTLGAGSTFTVLLPPVPEPDASPTARSSTVVHRSTAPILVVEDEDAAREGIVELLGLLGHAAAAAGTGEEALELADELGCRVLLTDHALPGITGEAVARTLRARDPDLPVILMSGYPPSDAIRDDVQDGRIRFLQKPFRAEHLREVLDEALAEPTDPIWSAP